jgi:hypothetical protein
MKTLTAALVLALVLIQGDVADTPNLDETCVIAGDCVWNEDGTVDGEDNREQNSGEKHDKT